MVHDWISISIGFLLLAIGYLAFLKVMPKKLANPDLTLFHLKQICYMSFTLVISGIFLIVLGFFITALLKVIGV